MKETSHGVHRTETAAAGIGTALSGPALATRPRSGHRRGGRAELRVVRGPVQGHAWNGERGRLRRRVSQGETLSEAVIAVRRRAPDALALHGQGRTDSRTCDSRSGPMTLTC